MLRVNTPCEIVIASPVVSPIGDVHPEGVTDTMYVPPFASFEDSLPLTV